MRKVLAAALAVMQMLFAGGMVAYQKTVDRNLAANGTEFTFAADGSFWVWGNTPMLALRLRMENGEVKHNDRYWEILTGADGLSTVRRRDVKPLSGAYINATGHADSHFYGWLEKEVYVTKAFERTFFPGLPERYCEQNEIPPEEAEEYYGTEDINDPFYGHTFAVKAKVWKGNVTITDYLVDGQSLKEYIRFAQETADADPG